MRKKRICVIITAMIAVFCFAGICGCSGNIMTDNLPNNTGITEQENPDNEQNITETPETNTPIEQDPPKDEHVHVMQTVAETLTTCTVDGNISYYICTECKKTFADENGEHTISAEEYTVSHTGHDYTETITLPTCTTDGYTTYTCKHCGDIYTNNIIPATNHDYTEEVTLPTCITDGYTTYTCKNCGDTYTDNIVPATNHEYTEEVTLPTCTTDGYTTYTCKHCGDIYTNNIIPATNHEYTEEVTPPTCTTDGYTTYTCKHCDDTYTDNVIPATNHEYTEEVTLPTCTTDGYTTYTCKHCGDNYISDEVPATGHKNGTVWKYDDGMHWKETVCEECGEKYTTEREEHEYIDWECACGKREVDEYELLFEETESGYSVIGIEVTSDGTVEVIIPSEHNGKAVIEIGNNAFKDNTDITSVFIPATVKRIGQRAFEGCRRLNRATFGNPKGWYAAMSATATRGPSISFDKTTMNVGYLTVTYKTYYLFCKE